MWDLTVSDVHTFAVGEGPWVVHNAGPCVSRDRRRSVGPAQEACAAIPPEWGIGEPTRAGGGTRWFKPGSARSDGIQIMPGDPNVPGLIHSGPYVEIVSRGVTYKVPLAGNPTLGSP